MDSPPEPSPFETAAPRHARPSQSFGGGSASGRVVVFTWAGDRWSHRVLPGPQSAPGEPVWESVEGPWPVGGDPRWPASPVIVELSRVPVHGRREAGREALVGVGLAGRSHFSASVISDPRLPDAIRFELACRVTEPPLGLGSLYRVGGSLVQITADDVTKPLPQTVVWAYSIGPDGIAGVVGATVTTGPA